MCYFFPFSHYEAISIYGTDRLNTLIKWSPNPDPMEKQTKVFKSYKKIMCWAFIFPTQKKKLMARISSINFPLTFKKTDLYIYNIVISKLVM